MATKEALAEELCIPFKRVHVSMKLTNILEKIADIE
jgi:hypothetical protein